MSEPTVSEAWAELKAALGAVVMHFPMKILNTRMLCDGCDKTKFFVRSVDGRTLVCPRCRIRGHLTGAWRE